MVGGDVVIENVLTEHLKPLLAKLSEAGVVVEKEIDSVKEKLSKLENKEILKKYSLDWLAIKSLENDMILFANLKTKYGVDNRNRF